MAKKNEINGLRQRTHDRVDYVMDHAGSMSQRGKETMANIKNKAILMREKVTGYIKQNPKKTVMYAAGAGAIAGAVTTATFMRRNHKNHCCIDSGKES